LTTKKLSVLALGGILAAAACSPFHQTYWKRIDPDSALYLTGPAATQKLDEDIAACTSAVDNVNRLDQLRETMPPDTDNNSQAAAPLAYYDTPTRAGEEKVAHSDYHDFEGCMRNAGWERQDTMRYQTMAAASDNYQNLQSVRETGLTVDQKHAADEAVIAARKENLVAPGTHGYLGLQGYRDTYKEKSIGAVLKTTYTGVVASYTSRDTGHGFWTVDGRAAHGNMSYSSPASGTMSGVPDYEGELRSVWGKDYPWLDDSWLSPYGGLGLRIYRDNGKGHFTNLGAFAYDRRIDQLYIPFGVTSHTLLFDHISMANTLEGDVLMAGYVDSRLQNFGGSNVVNTQGPFTGYGIRGEMMFGLPQQSASFELGPFFRYWNVSSSSFNIQA
jgi:hypothetical protein